MIVLTAAWLHPAEQLPWKHKPLHSQSGKLPGMQHKRVSTQLFVSLATDSLPLVHLMMQMKRAACRAAQEDDQTGCYSHALLTKSLTSSHYSHALIAKA